MGIKVINKKKFSDDTIVTCYAITCKELPSIHSFSYTIFVRKNFEESIEAFAYCVKKYSTQKYYLYEISVKRSKILESEPNWLINANTEMSLKRIR